MLYGLSDCRMSGPAKWTRWAVIHCDFWKLDLNDHEHRVYLYMSSHAATRRSLSITEIAKNLTRDNLVDIGLEALADEVLLDLANRKNVGEVASDG